MKIIFTSILAAYILIEILHLDSILKKVFKIPFHKRIKPFDCMTCLSTWICICMVFIPAWVTDRVFLITCTSVLANIIGYFITAKKLNENTGLR